MGCDIHLYFEKKNKEGKWEEIVIDERLLPDDRNYLLFAFLAGVRNYFDEKIIPQFAGRGIPEDNSMPENDTEDFWIGDYSFTYAYLDEILNAPWDSCDDVDGFGLEQCYFIIFCREIIPRLVSFCGILSEEERRNIRVIMGFDN